MADSTKDLLSRLKTELDDMLAQLDWLKRQLETEPAQQPLFQYDDREQRYYEYMEEESKKQKG